MRTFFAVLFSFCLCGFLSAAEQKTDLSVLPQGAVKQALDVPCFPDKSYAFLFRNWNLIGIDRLAAVLKTSPENVQKTAQLMGLPPYKEPAWTIDQIYITLVRRNWHLLPWEQILVLLNYSPEKLAFNLKEDDFLWIKLGLLKPVCSPVYYHDPSPAERKELEKISSIIAKEFPGAAPGKEEARFAFIDHLKKIDPAFSVRSSDSPFRFQMIHSYFGGFGDPLIDPKADPFPEGYLQKLAKSGVNAVWFHVVLRDLAPGTDAFPDFGKGHEIRIARLKDLAAKLKKYGIGIYLYMNEPRSLPESRFKEGSPFGGAVNVHLKERALCVSAPEVQKWLTDSLSYVFTQVPDLAGVFTITASENFTNCASHGEQILKSCPRCSLKGYAKVIADTNRMIEEAVHRASPNAEVLVWDWGWFGNRPGYGAEIIEQLPKKVRLMSVSEHSILLDRGGIPTKVEEYSISAVGPGPRAISQWDIAQKAGLKTAAKVQLNTTWEIGSVPYIPVPDLIARHCRNLLDHGVDSMMAGWSLGGYPSMNLMIPQLFKKNISVDSVLNDLALLSHSEEGVPLTRKGWTTISKAFEEFPFAGTQIVYQAPIQIGPANPLYLKPTGYASTMVGIPYDALNRWRGPYPPEIFAGQFEKMEKGFLEGAGYLEKALAFSRSEFLKENQDQVRMAKTIGTVYGSVANQTRFILLRDQLAAPGISPEKKKEIIGKMIPLVEKEIEFAKMLYLFSCEDSRIGFESTNHYWFVPSDLVEKVILCRWILAELNQSLQ
ncbi:MAG: hypothetical protein Q4G69_12275 [Planctomycetia bacterium]|nr:hypothetical protein [Planctomycetia bacterium]